MKKIFLLIVAGCSLSLCGCPDYSHLRSKPDYDNMTDPDTGQDGDNVSDPSDEQGESHLESRDE